MNLHNLVLIISLTGLYGCSKLTKMDEVLTDKRTTYQKSRDMPLLEVPPDLTVTKGQNRAIIPGEAESTTLSEFQRQREQRKRPSNSLLYPGETEDKQWLTLKGETIHIWPRLKQFWSIKGYKVELDDDALGAMKTGWKENGSFRDRYRIFVEPDEQGGTILFLSNEHQQKFDGEWLDSTPDTGSEKETLRELNLHFYGTAISRNDANTTTPEKPRAEILDLGDGKIYLVMPQEFTRAWHNTEALILRAGYLIQDKNQEKGTYNFLYIKPKKEKKGFLSKLKFWGDNDDGTPYQLSLTGVGDRTEAIVMSEDGEWKTDKDARDILDALRSLYNQI